MPLEEELKAYNEKLSELLPHEGKFVLIRGSKISGFFDTYGDAVQAGYERFNLQPFFVRQIMAIEPVHFVTVAGCQGQRQVMGQR